jgi:hypothetical protein
LQSIVKSAFKSANKFDFQSLLFDVVFENFKTERMNFFQTVCIDNDIAQIFSFRMDQIREPVGGRTIKVSHNPEKKAGRILVDDIYAKVGGHVDRPIIALLQKAGWRWVMWSLRGREKS